MRISITGANHKSELNFETTEDFERFQQEVKYALSDETCTKYAVYKKLDGTQQILFTSLLLKNSCLEIDDKKKELFLF